MGRARSRSVHGIRLGVSLAAVVVVSGVARSDDLPPCPDPLDPVRLGRRTARVLQGRVVATARIPGGNECPTAIADVVDAATRERTAGPVPLPWDAKAPPVDRWDPSVPPPPDGSHATVFVDSYGRLVAAVSSAGGSEGWKLALDLAAAPSSRFSDEELSWAGFAFRRLQGDGGPRAAIRESVGDVRDRWLELETRFGSTGRDFPLEDLTDVPSDILRIALAQDRVAPAAALRLAERGERDSFSAVKAPGARAARLRAADAAEIAATVREAANPRMLPSVAKLVRNAGAVESPELRQVMEAALRSGETAAAPALVALGATADEVLAISPACAGTVFPSEWPVGRAGESARLAARWFAASAKPEPYTTERAVGAMAAITRLIPAGSRADVLALLPVAEAVPALREPNRALFVAIRARLGDADAFAALSSQPDEETLARKDLKSVLSLLGDVPGPDATAVLLDALAPPPVDPAKRSKFGRDTSDGGPASVLANLAARSQSDRTFALARLDARFPKSPSAAAKFHLEIRWTLGSAPTAAALAAVDRTRPIRLLHAPRGTWGPDAELLRAELLVRRDWRTFLTLDGAVPEPLVQEAISAIQSEPMQARDRMPDAIELLVAARSPAAVPALRAALASGTARGQTSSIVRAIARSEAKCDLAAWAGELAESGRDAATGESKTTPAAWGFLVALVEGRR